MPNQCIELDCAPGSARPDSFIGQVIEGTGLKPKETCSRSFGNWIWNYSEIPENEWKEIRPVLEERIKKLFENGHIRYGSW